MTCQAATKIYVFLVLVFVVRCTLVGLGGWVAGCCRKRAGTWRGSTLGNMRAAAWVGTPAVSNDDTAKYEMNRGAEGERAACILFFATGEAKESRVALVLRDAAQLVRGSGTDVVQNKSTNTLSRKFCRHAFVLAVNHRCLRRCLLSFFGLTQDESHTQQCCFGTATQSLRDSTSQFRHQPQRL